MRTGTYLVADTTFIPRCPHCGIQIGASTKNRLVAVGVIKAHLELHQRLGRVRMSITAAAMFR